MHSSLLPCRYPVSSFALFSNYAMIRPHVVPMRLTTNLLLSREGESVYFLTGNLRWNPNLPFIPCHGRFLVFSQQPTLHHSAPADSPFPGRALNAFNLGSHHSSFMLALQIFSLTLLLSGNLRPILFFKWQSAFLLSLTFGVFRAGLGGSFLLGGSLPLGSIERETF